MYKETSCPIKRNNWQTGREKDDNGRNEDDCMEEVSVNNW